MDDMDDMDMAWTMDDMDRLVPRATIPSIPSIVHSRPCAAGMSIPSIPRLPAIPAPLIGSRQSFPRSGTGRCTVA